MDNCIEEQSSKRIKLEVSDRPLNFAINPDDFDLQCVKKPKIPRDPMSHRIIEKRRRDRMNNCLAELSRLIPSNYLKQGQGRIEKTEIIEMASKHIRHLQNLTNFHGGHLEKFQVDGSGRHCCEEKFYMGFKECQDEALRFYIEFEGRDIKDPVCINLSNHLEQTSQKFLPQNQDPTQISSKKEEITMENMGSSHGNLLSVQDTNVSAPMDNNVNHHESFLHALLLPKESTTSVNGSISESSHSVLSTKSTDGYYNMREEGDTSYGTGSNYQEKSNSTTTDSDRDSSSNGGSQNHAYKFKHNITKRFSQEEKREIHNTSQSDTSSSSSREDEKEKVKRKYPRHKIRGSQSSDSQYFSSASDNNRPDFSSTNIPLPAFVLHPDGTHYLPISIHPSHFENVFSRKEMKENPIYHPISIPVNFDGPFLAMNNLITRPGNDNSPDKNQKSPTRISIEAK